MSDYSKLSKTALLNLLEVRETGIKALRHDIERYKDDVAELLNEIDEWESKLKTAKKTIKALNMAIKTIYRSFQL